ncbi:hypothetical protein BBJ28_00023307 [Nothophytophthora sp. Chile5]|nr:hypothetical protein BBJ28_00023307 [Nothophytophthora sp. Chile5]
MDGASSANANQLLKAGREPCRDFVAGTCNRGDYCIYNHDIGTAKPPITAPPTVGTTSVAVEAKPKFEQPPPEAGAEMTPATKSKKKKAMEPCRRFAAGACYIGDNCKYVVSIQSPDRYSHATVAGQSPSVVVAPTIQGIPSSVVCRHYTRGYCSVGAACRFAHVLGGPELPKPPTSEASVPKKKRPCLFFASGVCTRGDQCSFLHEVKEAPVAPAPAVSKPSPVVSAPKARVAAVEDSESSDDSEEETVEEESRTCIECEKPGIAIWKCVKCENALYCNDCNAAVHRARVMAKHVRSKLPPVPEKPKLPLCGECETQDASVLCAQCEVPYCASCDASVHKFKSLRKHERVELTAKTEKPKPKAKARKEVAKVEKKEKKEKKQKKQKPVDPTPVPYVESVPQLDLSSESESSESEAEVEDEEMPIEVAAIQQPIYSAPQAQQQPIDVSSESEEDDDEPMAPSPAASRPPVLQSKPVAAQVEASEDSDDDFDDVKPQTSTPVAVPSKTSVKEASSDSESSSSEDEAPAPPTAVPAPARRTMPAPATNRPAGISSGSSHTLVKKIEIFHESGEGEELHLDSNLNGFERLLAHDCAERLGLAHESTGAGLERHITISRRGVKRSAAASSSQKAKKSKHHH